jgi:hypothetical protein
MIKRHAAFLELAGDLLASGHSLRFAAEGMSMFPAIHSGDTIVVSTVDPARIVAGDIVLCRHRGRAMLHRVTGVRRRTDRALLVLRGDAEREQEAEVPPALMLGKVVEISPGYGRTRGIGRWAWRHVSGLCDRQDRKPFVP